MIPPRPYPVQSHQPPDGRAPNPTPQRAPDPDTGKSGSASASESAADSAPHGAPDKTTIRPPREALLQTLFPHRTALTAAAGCGGAALFWLIGLPAPLLLGSIVATLTLALSGVRLAYPRWLQMGVLGVIGVNVGGTLSSDLLSQVMVWLPSVIGQVTIQMIALAVGCWVMVRLGRQSLSTALLSSYPGHLVMVLGASTDSNANSGVVAIAQSLRLVTLAVFVPLVLGHGGDAGTAAAKAAAAPPFDISSALVVAAAGVCGMLIGIKIRLPTPLLLGGIIGAGAATLGGFSLGPLPHLVGPVLLLIVGTMIGARFSGMARQALLQSIPRCIVTVAAVLITVAIGAWPMSLLLGIPFGQLLLAYTPGGGDVMPLLALAQGYDAVFVGVHHGARLMVMGVLLPLALRLPAVRR